MSKKPSEYQKELLKEREAYRKKMVLTPGFIHLNRFAELISGSSHKGRHLHFEIESFAVREGRLSGILSLGLASRSPQLST